MRAILPASQAECRLDTTIPGRMMERWMTRAQSPGLGRKGQYGGNGHALILLALELDRIRGAVLTGARQNSEPVGRVCRTRAEVLECAGSKYSGRREPCPPCMRIGGRGGLHGGGGHTLPGDGRG